MGLMGSLIIGNTKLASCGILEKKSGIHVFLKSSFLFLAFLTGASTSEDIAEMRLCPSIQAIYIHILYKYIVILIV